ncbi:MAG: HAMP domain-containing protein [Bryobacteraceae bacterium]|nr:HAMP domain-containing protein [Bryobacteraceae bacterium]
MRTPANKEPGPLPAWKRIPRGLRFRLALSYVFFFALILAGIGVVFRQTLATTLQDHARAMLEEDWAAVRAYLRIERRGNRMEPVWYYDKNDPDEAFFVERLKRVFILADAEGRILEISTGYLSLGPETPETIRKVMDEGADVWKVRLTGHGLPYLVRFGTILDERRRPYFMAIGRPITDSAGILSSFTWEYLALAPFLLVSSAVIGWFFARRALQPVNALAETAGRISASNMNLRIPQRGAEDELDNLIATFNSMMDRLNASLQQSRQFSADVSHEIRTPLTSIRGQLEVALLTCQTAEQYREAILNSLQDVDRLAQIVKTLLLLSQAEAGHLVLQKAAIDLSALTRDLVAEFQIPAEEARVSLHADLPDECVIEADRVQIERLVSNLLSNAVKYTPAGGTVRVSLQRRDRWVEIEVADTGIGIPKDYLPHIFERFFRVPNSDPTSERGLGLGLSFVNWIVKAHGGRINVESEVGKGSRFTVGLPAGAHQSTNDTAPLATRPA